MILSPVVRTAFPVDTEEIQPLMLDPGWRVRHSHSTSDTRTSRADGPVQRGAPGERPPARVGQQLQDCHE